MTDDRELEELRRRRLMELQKEAMVNEESSRREEEERKALQKERQELLKRLLTPEAIQRLSNVRLARPEVAENVENQIIALAQSGRLNRMITDSELKAILARLTEKREIKIERR
ncbi:MAG: DNA-binding protein [Thermoplasmata archaeon]